MKKRILSFIMCMMLPLSFAACGQSDTQSSDSDDVSSEESVAEIKMPVINGVELSEFTVVYKEQQSALKYQTAAREFVSYVRNAFGVTLQCVSETFAETENEIIFGLANRPIAQKNMVNFNSEYGKFNVVIEGTKVLFAASYANGAQAAAEEFCKRIEASEDGIFENQVFSGEKDIIKVACVGDSITQGSNSTDPKNMTYPVYIQEMLGLDYYVLNAGLSGHSICKIDDMAYSKHYVYTTALDFKPDVVLFALGTNDANPNPDYPSKDWNNPANNRVEVFKESANELLDSFINVNPDVQIYMILPASLFKVGGDFWKAEAWTANILDYVQPMLKDIAEQRGLPIVDLFEWSKEHPDIFTDGLHPKDLGYKVFAKYIYDSVKDTIKTVE